MKVFLSGEGPNELGGWHRGAPYQTSDEGVLEALARREAPGAWKVVGAMPWKSIFRLTEGAGRGDGRSIRRLVDHVFRDFRAQERPEVLLFARDLDGSADREKEIAATLSELRIDYPELTIVGAGMKPCLEGWVLAATGTPKTESMTKAKAQAMCSAEIGTTTAEFVTAIGADPAKTAPDAPSLKEWLSEAKKALTEAHA